MGVVIVEGELAVSGWILGIPL